MPKNEIQKVPTRGELLRETVLTPEETTAKTKAELTKYGLRPKENVKIKNPITGNEATVELSRTGVQEYDLISVLADPNANREKKDYALSTYLWGRGAESASMMVDLMRYKGEHTKETRVFKSQIRFDFEALVESISSHLETQAKNTADILGINLKEEIEGYRRWLKEVKDGKKSYLDFYMYSREGEPENSDRVYCAMVSQAIYQLDEAEKLVRARKNIAAAREREKGKGIYIDRNGKPYTMDDPSLDDVIKADREATKEIEHE